MPGLGVLFFNANFVKILEISELFLPRNLRQGSWRKFCAPSMSQITNFRLESQNIISFPFVILEVVAFVLSESPFSPWGRGQARRGRAPSVCLDGSVDWAWPPTSFTPAPSGERDPAGGPHPVHYLLCDVTPLRFWALTHERAWTATPCPPPHQIPS